MITLYKELKQVGMVKRLYTFYGVSLLMGIVLIYILFTLGNYLQWFSFVVLLRAVLQPYFHFKMRLPLYKVESEIKNEKGECKNLLNDYYTFNLFCWKKDYRRARILDYTVLLMIFFCLITGIIQSFAVEHLIFKMGIIFLNSIFITVYTIFEGVRFNSLCKCCEEGDIWSE